MLSSRRKATFGQEAAAATQLPYVAHVAPNLIKTSSGQYLQSLRLGGVSFETVDDVVLNDWHERLNALWRNIASPNLALWTHLIRRRLSGSVALGEANNFAEHLHRRYRRRLADESLMVNELYLSVLYRPTTDIGSSVAAQALKKMGTTPSDRQDAEALEACGRTAQFISAALALHEPEELGAYQRNGTWCSSLVEFLALLANGEWQPMPLPRGPLSQAMVTSRMLFGSEVIEYRMPAATRIGAMLGIKEYPAASAVGVFDRLLSLPFPLVLTQSFTFLSRATSQGLLQRQIHRLANSGDFALSQAEALSSALDSLASNDFVMGDHHLSLQVIAEVPGSASTDGVGAALRELNARLAAARNALAETGMTVAREDLALEAAFWAQFPGNSHFRPRKAPITSRNFAAMAASHNYPCGRAVDNHWGDALALLMTSAHSPYHFSLHASDPAEVDGGSRKDTGHTLICGPTGSGKTVFVGFMVAMLYRAGATQVIIDKDRGLEILVRALGGEYLALPDGVASGLNPLQLPATPVHVEFLKQWLHALLRPPRGGQLSAREQVEIDQALRGVLALDPESRRLSMLIEFLDATAVDGLHTRLAPWCERTHGAYAWVFDNRVDTLSDRMGAGTLMGIDVSDFLNNSVTRAPLTLYLFHLIRQLLDGRRMVCWLDEFWRLLADPAFTDFAKDGPKTWRKLNGAMCFATQSTSDVLVSDICRTVVEQTATKVFFPNPDASASEYVDQLGLSEREFRLIKERLNPGARQFLVKQGHASVVCELDLKGFDAELSVLAGRRSTVEKMHQAMARFGTDPGTWLPAFLGNADA